MYKGEESPLFDTAIIAKYNIMTYFAWISSYFDYTPESNINKTVRGRTELFCDW